MLVQNTSNFDLVILGSFKRLYGRFTNSKVWAAQGTGEFAVQIVQEQVQWQELQ